MGKDPHRRESFPTDSRPMFPGGEFVPTLIPTLRATDGSSVRNVQRISQRREFVSTLRPRWPSSSVARVDVPRWHVVDDEGIEIRVKRRHLTPPRGHEATDQLRQGPASAGPRHRGSTMRCATFRALAGTQMSHTSPRSLEPGLSSGGEKPSGVEKNSQLGNSSQRFEQPTVRVQGT